MLRPVTYRALAPYLALAIVTALLIVFGLKLPMSRLDVPYTLDGDEVDKMAQVQTVAETGWLFDNDRLGYPFGYDRLDFPRFDSLNYAIMGPIAAITGKPGLVLNLYFITGFFLIAFAAFYTLRRLEIETCPAFIGAVVYAFLPYHVMRGVAHVTNGAYFLVPLAFLVLVWIARGDLDRGTPNIRSRWWVSLTTAFLVPLQTPYNGVFFAYLCVVAGLLSVTRNPRWRTVLPALIVVSAVAGAFVLELAPVLIHSWRAGEPTLVAARSPAEADTYSLRLNQVLLPTTQHGVRPVARAKRAFDHAFGVDKPYTEVSNQYMGLFGVAGFLALFWALACTVTARADTPRATNPEDVVRIAVVLTGAIVVLAVPSGLDTLVAYGITAKIRAYNRILPFFVFPCVLAACWLLQQGLRRIGKAWLRNVAVVAVGLISAWDLMVRPFGVTHRIAIGRYDAYAAYFQEVENRLGPGSAVFQDPVIWYPEHPTINRMFGYEEFLPYLFTKTLRFSYGGAHGRRGYAWGRYIQQRPAAEMIQGIHAMGFAAILIDSYAYANDAALHETTGALEQILPTPPFVSADQRWWLLALDGCCGAPAAQIPPGAPPKVFPLRADGLPVRFDEGGSGWLYIAGGWWDPEDWGIWSAGDTALLRMRLDPAPKERLALTLETRMLLGPKVQRRELTVEGNGQRIGAASYVTGAEVQLLRFDIPAGLVKDDGLLELAFTATPKTTLYWATGTFGDDRLLGIGLANMSLAPADGMMP